MSEAQNSNGPTAVAVANRTALVPAQRREMEVWHEDKNQVEILKRDLCPDLDDLEFQVYLGVCRATGLNPLMKQIYAIKRKDNKSGKSRVSYQTGIDGYRLIAQRTSCYAGSDDAVFSKTLIDGKFPAYATVTVYKLVQGVRCPFSATARWKEYYPANEADGFMWRKMPHGQLAKVSEALALRKAFPAELSPLYSDVEMQQAGNPDVIEAQAVTVQRMSRQKPPVYSREAAQEAQDGQNGPSGEYQDSEDVLDDDDGSDEAAAADIARMEREELERQNAAQASVNQGGPDFNDGDWRKIVVGRISSKTGTGARGAWTRTSVQDVHTSEWFGTFDTKIADRLTALKGTGREAWVKVEMSGANANIVELWGA